MSMTKRYLENIICLCSEEKFGQDAVEWAILSGRIKLTFRLEADLRTIMGEPGSPETGQYSAIIEAYQMECHKNEALLMRSYAPILKKINQLPDAA